ncbi:hypothetical protein [Streptomyces litchfieldiae]|uniref:Uncharacterized protein n=1 Tax=Streptomyces litchfieldiae TaxID=3075543 RepID=A0ABU2MJ01_9ACTN|nr:hypothetical protein [Streptomyces sp. DSM 44938]MDT0341446.1 hypothetical protein [Streptomyces sp. DSM 44938]
MGDDSTQTSAPATGPHARYFTKDGEGIQAVYNLRDATAYRELGYQETDEQAYLASLPDPVDGPCRKQMPN